MTTTALNVEEIYLLEYPHAIKTKLSCWRSIILLIFTIDISVFNSCSFFKKLGASISHLEKLVPTHLKHQRSLMFWNKARNTSYQRAEITEISHRLISRISAPTQ